MRRMLANKRVQGPGSRHALIFALRPDSPGVQIPRALRGAAGHPVEIFVLQHQFWGLEDDANGFKVTLAFRGARQQLTIPYAALIDFYERVDPAKTDEGEPFSSSDVPLDAGAISNALAEKVAMGPGKDLGIQLRAAANRCSFEPRPLSTMRGSHIDLLIDLNYWNLVVFEHHFEIVVLDDLERIHVSVPYDAIEEMFAFSFIGEEGPARLGREVTTLTEEEMEAAGSSQRAKINALLSSIRPSLALGMALTALVWISASPVLIYLSSTQHNVPASHILFFSYLSPDILSALEAGYVPLATLLSDLSLLGGLGALWAAFLGTTALSLSLPMYDDKPMHMQAGITGFFYAYVVTLLIYGGFTISYRYVPGILRILWIVLLFAVGERLKRAYPPRLVGALYFPQFVDGMFAIAASLIIAQGINDTYDQALSGPAFVLIYFIIMLLFGRRMVRAILLRQFVRTFMAADDIEIPRGGGSRVRAMSTAAKGLFGHFRRKRERLVLLPFEELVAEYRKEFSGKDGEPIKRFHWKNVKIGWGVGIFALMLVWSVIILFALWAATNLNLYILGVGR